jgi:prevent-host-death family protein
MRELKSDAARRGFRDLLDEVERDPEAAIRISRYDRPVAVLVSAAWYERMTAERES